MLGALHTLLGIVKELEAFYRWASKPQLPLFTTGFCTDLPGGLAVEFLKHQQYRPYKKDEKMEGFAGKGVDSNLGKCF